GPRPARLEERVTPGQLRLGRLGAHWKTIWGGDRNRLPVPADLRWKSAYEMNQYLPSGLRELHVQAVRTHFRRHHGKLLESAYGALQKSCPPPENILTKRPRKNV